VELDGHALGIGVLCQKALLSMLEHAGRMEQLDAHSPDQATVTLHLTDDLFLRSFTWARSQLGIPLPVNGS
jgi:hypothetical protein